jgi:pyruvate/2-oxoglutarate dehydrogenase complex dihydrolipoamide acyltransferase (E2) component
MELTLVKLPEYIQYKILEVNEIYVAIGDIDRCGEPLIEVASKNICFEIPSPCHGLVVSINIRIGDSIRPKTDIGILINSKYSSDFYRDQRLTAIRFSAPSMNLLNIKVAHIFEKAWSVHINSELRLQHEIQVYEQVKSTRDNA